MPIPLKGKIQPTPSFSSSSLPPVLGSLLLSTSFALSLALCFSLPPSPSLPTRQLYTSFLFLLSPFLSLSSIKLPMTCLFLAHCSLDPIYLTPYHNNSLHAFARGEIVALVLMSFHWCDKISRQNSASGERVCVSSLFRVTVRHCGEAMATGA